MTAPIRPRRLTEAEMDALPHFADLRTGKLAEPKGNALAAMICAAFVGGLVWALIARAVYAAMTGDVGEW